MCAQGTTVANGEKGNLIVKTGGVRYESPDKPWGPSTTYVSISHEWATNPDTEVAWTWADIDNLQIGGRLYKQYAEYRITQIYVEVDYTPSGWANIATVLGATATDGVRLNGATMADLAKVTGAAV